MAVEFSGSVNRGKLLPHGVFVSLDLSWSAPVNHETKVQASSVVKRLKCQWKSSYIAHLDI